MTERVAQVLIDGASDDLTFSYSVPGSLAAAPGVRVRVPLRGRQAVGTVTSVEEVDPATLKFRLRPLSGVVADEPFLTPGLMKLAQWIARYYLCSLESVYRAMLPKPSRGEVEGRKTAKRVRVLTEAIAVDDGAWRPRAKRQAELLDFLQEEGPQLLADLTGPLGYGRGSVSGLEERGLVEVVEEVVDRNPDANISHVASQPLELNPEQADALRAVEESAEKVEAGEQPVPILLRGVTGSGKTEVYLQAIQRAVERGKGAIVLVPEIALTPQTADRFKQRFAHIQDEVAILHSNLSEGERHDEWRKVLDRRARIVIGARSAIFSPISDLGLIVVDEEHENSYKQDTNPRYHARDVAVVRGHLEGCPVLLGSATPSLESWKNAESGKYRLVELRQRIDDRKLPLIRVLDMKVESRKFKGGITILSGKLRDQMEQRLADGEQTILFLNRRGFARHQLCPECGYVTECGHCSTTMTFHRRDHKLVCHICGFSRLPPRKCPDCGADAIVNAGFGTEKVEEVLREVFKSARIARVDTDTMRRKNQLRETLTAFKAKKIDILLGTQMIAKGLHFPNVTLVGILNADTGLHIPDFRAGERTFQLITQVAGRAGRGELEGEVVVQTFTPHHPAIQFGRHHDYEGFAEQELALRRQFGHPPFLHLALVTVRSTHKERAEFSLKTLHGRLKKTLPEGMTLTEPLPSPLEKSHDQWRFQVLLKSARARALAAHLRGTLDGLTFPDDVIVTVDLDPYVLS